MSARTVSLLKRLRTTQPLNWLTTSTARTVLSAAGVRPEVVVKHLHRVGTVTSRLPNGRVLRLWSRGDDWVSNQVFWRGWDGYEPETGPLFFRLAQRSEVTLDVGAYVGYFTLLAAHANPSARVFAFEPMKAIAARLRHHVACNRLSNVECTEAAVGECEGTAEFFHTPRPFPTSSSLSREFMGTTGIVSSRVTVLALDRFLRDRNVGRVDLVKIDTESTEPQVLRGMRDCLERDRPTLVCEVLKDRGAEQPLEAVLGPLGYRYYLLTPDGPVLRDRIEGHPDWLNYLFTTQGPERVAQL